MKKKIDPTIKGPMPMVGCRIQDQILDYLDSRARRRSRDRSSIIRELLVEALRAENIVFTEAELEAMAS